jgi:ubiquinone/menaquinone biosynthesis C-methylase UbiE
LSDLLSDARAEEDRIREKYARRKRTYSRYSWFNAGHVLMLQERERRVLDLLRRAGVNSLKEERILEIGCGHGFWLREFIKWGAQPENLTGVELLADRAEQARRLSPERVNVICGSAAKLAFPDGSFNLVLQSTAFTSMQDIGFKRTVAQEMMRVVRPDGLILWYDFRMNNPRNPDVTGVRKREILELFGGCRVELYPLTLAPPLARRVASWSWLGCYLLAKVPFLCTHYLGVIRRVEPERRSR